MVEYVKEPGFVEQEHGVSMVEGLIVFPLVLLMFAAFFEFGFAVHQWNQTAKALQLGARLLAVSDPLIADKEKGKSGKFITFGSIFADDLNGLDPGSAVPLDIVTASCGVDADAPCKLAEINRLVYGSDDKCSTNYGTSLPGMCDFNEYIGVRHVRVTYYRAGLGFVGRPGGPVVTVSVQLPNLAFHLPLTQALLGGDDFTVPAHPVTMTSEDLSSCKSTC